MTIECGNFDLIDEIELVIKGIPFVQKNRKLEKAKPSQKEETGAKKDELVYEEDRIKQQIAQNKRRNLIEFKNQVKD